MGVGRTLGLLLGIALVSGGALALRRPPLRANDVVWTFSQPHADQIHRVASTGVPVHVEVIASRALDVRLGSLPHASEPAIPDLVEIEIGSVGKYLRGSLEDVPFVPLTARLRAGGWLARLSAARLSVWSKDGEVFGVPLDVHPVSLSYRKDLFDAANIDLASAETWPEFHDRLLAFEKFERAHGRHTRAMQLPSGSADVLVMMLQQRCVDLIDADDRPNLTDPRIADTLAFYARLVAGGRRVGADASPGPARWADDIARGDVAAVLTPDWAIDSLRRASPPVAGTLAMRPLPAFDPSDAPTASWGGTMVAIPRACPDPDAAWALLQRLYLSQHARAVRASGDILPAVSDWWDDRARAVSDPTFGHQSIRVLYRDLARRLPPRVVTPHTATATSALSLVLYRTTKLIDEGASDEHVRAQVGAWLADADADLQRRIRFATLGR